MGTPPGAIENYSDAKYHFFNSIHTTTMEFRNWEAILAWDQILTCTIPHGRVSDLGGDKMITRSSSPAQLLAACQDPTAPIWNHGLQMFTSPGLAPPLFSGSSPSPPTLRGRAVVASIPITKKANEPYTKVSRNLLEVIFHCLSLPEKKEEKKQ